MASKHERSNKNPDELRAERAQAEAEGDTARVAEIDRQLRESQSGQSGQQGRAAE